MEEFLSPGTFSSADEYAVNPRFLELQEELRSVLFNSLDPSSYTSPPSEPLGATETARTIHLDFTRVSIPKIHLVQYLENWITECAPYLDKFDETRTFGVYLPVLANKHPALLYAILAFSARQMERKASLEKAYESLELYQVSIRLLGPSLQAKDPNALATGVVLAVMELMSVSPRDWRRHVEGCAALFDSFNVNGLSGGHLQAVFWCYARMELCGAMISNGTESTVLPLEKWVPAVPEAATPMECDIIIRDLFCEKGIVSPDMHANWSVYLCAKTCHLSCRNTRYVELGEVVDDPRSFLDRWTSLWNELQYWREKRPRSMLPLKTIGQNHSTFPEILFPHWAAISANQLYHTACIIMLDMRPVQHVVPPSSPIYSSIYHSRRVCGISLTNPHSGSLINAIQPLYIAGKLLSHHSEHVEVARLFKTVEETTGWGALWRLKDLERAWGYEAGELLSAI
ncbi:hypothetical protein N7466_003043 [Penicillium verhagenii]|uniref:uncharacterized protein n=1 Tax=Penicillium verhagenii TaxID=1562060 RepID=UPI002545AB86|nr:uncharacterized protein N7466_003043 [Penicillium verhagenii]KAJ5936593.1 hypothetical protein N7466_003043 [Penicillium verhagenii]